MSDKPERTAIGPVSGENPSLNDKTQPGTSMQSGAAVPSILATANDATIIHGGTQASVGEISLSSASSTSAGPELPPEYELVNEIARGGMGVVYKARHRKLNRLVALKMILPHMLYDQSAIERFYQEARAAAALDHPNIVPIHEVGEFKGQHFFTMSFIEGESLRHRIKRQRPTIRESVKLLIGIADGVGYGHQRGIIHRDLKPDNVLIDQQGRPRVTDFGLAKQVESNSGLTATGQVMGTPSFMSPEQALGGKRTIGPPTDVYALGAILYNMLTGFTPFDGDSVTEVLCKVISDTPPSLRGKCPEVPESLEAIYQKSMARDPNHRFPTATELAEALREWEQSSDAAPTRPDLRNNRTVSNDLVQNTLFPSLINAPETPAVAAPTGGKPAWLFPVLGVLAVVIGGAIYRLTQGPSKTDAPKGTEVVEKKKDSIKEKIDNLKDLKEKKAGKELPIGKLFNRASLDLAKVIVPKEQVTPLIKPERRDFDLKIEFLSGVQDKDGLWKFKSGDPLQCIVTSDRDCYFGVWSVNADGTEVQLYPNDLVTAELLKAGESRAIPGKSADLLAAPSAGIDQLLFIAAEKPWDPSLGGTTAPFTIMDEKARKNRGFILERKKEAVTQEVIPVRVEK
jgi:serine/threonine protein kinase